MRGDLIETFKIMEFLITVYIFEIFLLKLEIYCQLRFQKISLLTNFFFLLIVGYVFGTNCLIRSKTTINLKLELDDLKNNAEKKTLKSHNNNNIIIIILLLLLLLLIVMIMIIATK